MLMRLLRRMQPLFVLLAVLFIALLLRSQWEELQSHEWQLNPVWLAASAGCLLLSWLVEVALWRRLLASVGGHLGYWSSLRVWFLSAIVRYIPGNIWQPLSITLLSQRRGVKPEATLTSFILYQVIILLGVAPLAALYFAGTGNWGLLTDMLAGAAPWLIALGMAPVVIFVVRPGWLVDLVNWGLFKLGRAPLPVGLARRDLLLVLGISILDWLLWGLTFCTLAFGLNAYTLAEMQMLAPHLIAVYPVAYAIGFISLLTPSGLGVREGALYLLLAPIVGGGTVTVLALAMRVWTTLGEVIAAAVCAVIPDRIDPEQPDAQAALPATAPDLRKGAA